MIIGLVLVGGIMITTIGSASVTANKALDNPESLRILAQAMR
jgi:hypothetical protein